jgi:hypothetical protein
MSEPEGPVAPPDGNTRIESLAAYFRAHGETFTPDALAQAARDGGYTESEIEAALAQAGRIATTAGPEHRARARWLVVAIYAATFLTFAALFLRPSSYNTYGAGTLALVILAVTLSLTLLVALWTIGRARPRATTANGVIAGLLVSPLILLVVVAGSCIATTAPFGLLR